MPRRRVFVTSSVYPYVSVVCCAAAWREGLTGVELAVPEFFGVVLSSPLMRTFLTLFGESQFSSACHAETVEFSLMLYDDPGAAAKKVAAREYGVVGSPTVGVLICFTSHRRTLSSKVVCSPRITCANDNHS